eukprot:TRINITY_DN7157_c0_g1_i1.p1 TRINITY_DN7157_c0_g1~~TRINITY_DN7157_c0_g1_i1.p1  ORF type:complete len:985 (+),score=306.96 TRINITY_DN7157_c0_g1_i1:57-3011(+)
MGIPAFFGWLIHKYTRLCRARGAPDEVDCIYVDFNGALHQGAREKGGGYRLDEAESIKEAIEYLEVLLAKVKPRRMIYVAIDGVAPRAKLRQQRSRRYTSAHSRTTDDDDGMFGGGEGEEGDHYQAQETAAELKSVREGLNLGIFGDAAGALEVDMPDADDDEVPLGLGLGDDDEPAAAAKPAGGDTAPAAEAAPSVSRQSSRVPSWDSNAITPGTSFMDKAAAMLREWATRRAPELGAAVVISDARAPGEGEQKIFDMIRREKAAAAERGTAKEGSVYQPGGSHIIVSADADVLLLSLALHEPHVHVMREKRFADPVDFEFVSISGFREYVAEELLGKIAKYEATAARQGPMSEAGPLDFERVIDDFVVMATLVGNDFVPRLPGAYVGQLTMDLLIDLYCRHTAMQRQRGADHHLVTEAGQVCPSAWAHFLRLYAMTEDAVFRQERVYDKEIAEEDAMGAMGSPIDETWRTIYYESTAEVTPPKAGTGDRQVMAVAWVEALTWVTAYYLKEGCLSWSWSYPFHHSPFAFDVQQYLTEAALQPGQLEQRLGEAPRPLLPFEQLCAVLPPSSFHLLPEQYAEVHSSLPSDYPGTWRVDLTGARELYHSVALLPDLDAAAMLRVAADVADRLPPEDSKRNYLAPEDFVAPASGDSAPSLFEGRLEPSQTHQSCFMLQVRAVGGADVPPPSRVTDLCGSRPPPVTVVDRPQYIPWVEASDPPKQRTGYSRRGSGMRSPGRGRSHSRKYTDTPPTSREPTPTSVLLEGDVQLPTALTLSTPPERTLSPVRSPRSDRCARSPVDPDTAQRDSDRDTRDDKEPHLSYLEHTMVKFHMFSVLSAFLGASVLSLAVLQTAGMGGLGAVMDGWAASWDSVLVHLLAMLLGFLVYPAAFGEQGRAREGTPPARRPKPKREVTALDHFKPKQCRIDWVCHVCLGKNFERNATCFRCRRQRDGLVDPPFYMTRTRWAQTCYEVDHRKHCSMKPVSE